MVMTIEFKGKWQFVMPEDVEGLERVLETDEGKVELLHALTQVRCHPQLFAQPWCLHML